MENSEKTIKSRSPLVKVHSIKMQTVGPPEPLAAELFISAGLFKDKSCKQVIFMDFSQKIDMRDTNGAYADRHQEVTVGESQDRLTYILSKK